MQQLAATRTRRDSFKAIVRVVSGNFLETSGHRRNLSLDAHQRPHRVGRHGTGDDDDGVALSHHGVHAYVRLGSAQALAGRRVPGDTMRGHFELRMAAGDGRLVRPHRATPTATHLHCTGIAYRD
jgi:hypothetical protein